MPATIHASEQTLNRIFSDDYAFEIPSYQRPYAWGRDQAAELLGDISTSLGDGNEAMDTINPYFLGSIVLIKTEDDPKADVVDGQQRLTTLTMLLAVLKTLIPQEIARGITRFLYQEGSLITGLETKYRLKQRERDAKFFQENIQDEDKISQLLSRDPKQLTDSQRGFQENARYFYVELLKISEDRRLRLLQYLIQRCYLVVVTTPDLDSAYRIFSVMNARGLGLEITDLLKSEIIGRIPESERTHYTQIWEAEEEDLGRDDFQYLFAHIRMIFRKAKQKESILREYADHVKPTNDPKGFIDNTLKPYSDAFEQIKDENYQSSDNADNVNSLFRWLNQIDNSDWMPPAILFLSLHQNNSQELLRFFTDLERLAAGLMILRADVNERLARYGRLLTLLDDKGKRDVYADSSPLQLTDEDRRRILETLNGNLYLMPRVRQYVLLRLDSSLSQAHATYQHSVLSIEHVLPQNPASNSQWQKDFPTAEMRDQWTHRIGNLVLLSRRKNAQAQNFDFMPKKSTYFTTQNGVSPFALTTQVLQESVWTPSVLEQRQQALLQRLKTVWRL